jgi:hypothetical protein
MTTTSVKSSSKTEHTTINTTRSKCTMAHSGTDKGIRNTRDVIAISKKSVANKERVGGKKVNITLK